MLRAPSSTYTSVGISNAILKLVMKNVARLQRVSLRYCVALSGLKDGHTTLSVSGIALTD